METPLPAVVSNSPLDRDPGRPRLAIVGVILLLAIPLRWAALDSYPHHIADEGGWPYAVRHWVEHDFRTFDYYMAPAYHWALGVPFRLFGATMSVARLSSALVAYVGLLLFYGLARRSLRNERAALLALLLLATSFGAILWDRRALIEPYQLTWIFAVIFFYLGSRRWELFALVLSVVGLVLTKATGAYILPVLFAASVFSVDGPLRDRRFVKACSAVLGVVAGGVILWLLAQLDPEEAAKGWSKDLVEPGVAETARIYFQYGRFGLDPQGIYHRLLAITRDAPLVCALAAMAVSQWITERKFALATWWCVGSLALIIVQAYVLQNHLAIVYPALILGAAGMLAYLHDHADAGSILGVRAKWTDVTVGLIVAYGAIRIFTGSGGEIPPSRDAIQWMSEHIHPDERVAAAPYVLMQIDAIPFDHNQFAPDYLPSKDTLLAHGIDWVVFDEFQWIAHCADRAGLDPDTAIRTMQSYGTLMFEEPFETYVIRLSDPAISDTQS